MPDLDRLLHPDVADAAADAADLPDFDLVERGGLQRRRNRRVLTAGAVAVLVAAVVLVGRPWLPGAEVPEPLPPAVTPSPTLTLPLRAPSQLVHPVTGAEGAREWLDGADLTFGPADLRRLSVLSHTASTQTRWTLEMADAYPRETALDAAGRVVEYGVVFDVDGDTAPDCQVGISNDNDTTSEPGDYRVWVKDLRTGRADDRMGGPYGIPIDFRHPGEPDDLGVPLEDRTLRLFFVIDAPSLCGDAERAAGLYAWSAVTEAGRTIWDFVPDAGWLGLR